MKLPYKSEPLPPEFRAALRAAREPQMPSQSDIRRYSANFRDNYRAAREADLAEKMKLTRHPVKTREKEGGPSTADWLACQEIERQMG